MPNVSVPSLKRENDSLKDEIVALKQNLEELQQSIKRQDPQSSNNGDEQDSSNGGEQPTRLITDAETLSTLESYGKSYDELRAESANSLKQLWSRLNSLSSRVEQIGDSVEQLLRYSFQYNIKIIGLPESEMQESASKTVSLCINLFKAAGNEIAHRIPTRTATSGPRPIVCKFTRRIAKEQVMNSRKEASKVSATSIGLPSSHSLENVRLFDHLTPLLQQLLADSKKFQKRNGFKFCWAKNFVIYLRRTDDSRPIQIKCHNDLVNFANQEGLPMS